MVFPSYLEEVLSRLGQNMLKCNFREQYNMSLDVVSKNTRFHMKFLVPQSSRRVQGGKHPQLLLLYSHKQLQPLCNYKYNMEYNTQRYHRENGIT